MPRIVSATKLNPYVVNQTVIKQGKGTVVENLSEYAARLCYASLNSMGHSDNFLDKRIDEGHLDIFEHATVSIEYETFETNSLLLPYPHSSLLEDNSLRYYTELAILDDKSSIITASLRVWLNMMKTKYAIDALPVLNYIAPHVFGEVYEKEREKNPSRYEKDSHYHLYDGYYAKRIPLIKKEVAPVWLNNTKVTLFAYNFIEDNLFKHHNFFTFHISHISRACSHQLVRHRRGSFSQASQRYIDLEKSKWGYVVPQSIGNNEEAEQVFWEIMQTIEDNYTKLRNLGIKKEDARSLLPNALQTELMVTMSQEDWRHFIWMRALDKAAQLEIRSIGISILEILFNIYPDAFREEWSYLNDNRERLTS